MCRVTGLWSLTRPDGLQGRRVCTTPACIKAASRLLSRLDPKTDPCQDFYQFSCGSFLETGSVPDDSNQLSTLQEMQDDMLRTTRRNGSPSAPNEPLVNWWPFPFFFPSFHLEQASWNSPFCLQTAVPFAKSRSSTTRVWAHVSEAVLISVPIWQSKFVLGVAIFPCKTKKRIENFFFEELCSSLWAFVEELN